MRHASLIIAVLTLLSALSVSTAFAGNTASKSQKWVYDYHAFVRLGEDAVLLHPTNQPLFFLASAQSVVFESWREVIVDNKRSLLQRADGTPIERYPRFVDFRVTVSARPKAIPELQPFSVDFAPPSLADVNEFLLGLHFRVRIFHALDVKVIEPKIVKLIGVPADVPYDERVYRLSFDLGDVSLEDRIVLEVLSPEGERLTKFHLDI